MSGSKGGRRSPAGDLGDRLRELVDEGADSAEEIHKKVAGLALEVLERNRIFERTVRDLRKVQEDAIGVVYEAVREINHSVVRLAQDVLEGKPARTARTPRTRKKAAAKKPAASKPEARPEEPAVA
jgi:hypothetical protein